MVQRETRPEPLTEGQTKGQRADTTAAPARPESPPPPPKPKESNVNSPHISAYAHFKMKWHDVNTLERKKLASVVYRQVIKHLK